MTSDERVAEGGAGGEAVEALAAELGETEALAWDFFPEPDAALDTLATLVVHSDWLTTRDAALVASVREEVAREVCNPEVIEAATRAVWEHFFDGSGSAGRYSRKEWPPPEQHMPWWRGIAEAALSVIARTPQSTPAPLTGGGS